MVRHPLILDNDGGVDDLAALSLLLVGSSEKSSIPHIQDGEKELIGVVVIDADCFAIPAANCCDRLIKLVAPELDCPIAISTLGPQSVPFPEEWRKDSINMLDLPCLNTNTVDTRIHRRSNRVDTAGEKLMANLVLGSPDPVTIVVTGPLSNVAWCIDQHGDAFCNNVRSVIIMGGAIDVEGNVFMKDRDGTAEWNLFWDATAAAAVIEADGMRNKLILFALDSTNSVPVTSEFVRGFGKSTGPDSDRPTPLADFLGSSWAMCTHYSAMFGESKGYYAWDALTAAFLLDKDICELMDCRIRVLAVKGSPEEGRTEPVEADEVGRGVGTVSLAVNIKAASFYKLCHEVAKYQ